MSEDNLEVWQACQLYHVLRVFCFLFDISYSSEQFLNRRLSLYNDSDIRENTCIHVQRHV